MSARPSRGAARSGFAVWSRGVLLRGVLVVAGLSSLVVTAAIVLVLLRETARFLDVENIGIADLLFDSRWLPLQGPDAEFGLAPLLLGTGLVVGIALLVAAPLGVLAGVHLHEFTRRGSRRWLSGLLEVVGELPTVLLGMVALHVLSPLLLEADIGFLTYNATSAGLALGLLLWPHIALQSAHALQVLPEDLRDAAYSLGATPQEAVTGVVLGAARPGLLAALLQAFARAVGETMIVLLAAGFHPSLSIDPRHDVQTLTSYVAQVFLGDASNLDEQYLSCYAAAFALFVVTVGATLWGHRVHTRFEERWAA